MTDIGFIGLGMMGQGMAGSLMRAGHAVFVDPGRSRAGAAALIARGARPVQGPAALASCCDAIVICVGDAVGVRAVFDAIEPAIRQGRLVIDATTSHPATTRELAARAAERGAVFADAPVTGGPPQAAAGALASLVGCRESDFPRVEAVVSGYSRVVRRFGDAGAGNTAKLINNFVTQGTAVLLARAFADARRAGLPLGALHDVMSAGAARSGTFEKMVPPAVAGDYDGAAFSLANARKDVAYYADMTAADGAESAVAQAILAVLDAGVAAGFGPRFVSQLLNPEVWSALGLAGDSGAARA